MKAHYEPGALITFCGLDGSGKTAMIKRLADFIHEKGFPLEITKQPTDAVRQSEIFRNFMDCPDHSDYEYRALSIIAAGDRYQHTGKVIAPWLREGKIVLSDRYFYSCIANLRARGCTEDVWIDDIEQHIVAPDLSVFMDIPVEIAVKRIRERAEEKNRYIDIELQYRLREEYLRLAEQYSGLVVSSLKDPETCFAEIEKAVHPILYRATQRIQERIKKV